jgi:hypothetical protein
MSGYGNNPMAAGRPEVLAPIGSSGQAIVTYPEGQ